MNQKKKKKKDFIVLNTINWLLLVMDTYGHDGGWSGSRGGGRGGGRGGSRGRGRGGGRGGFTHHATHTNESVFKPRRLEPGYIIKKKPKEHEEPFSNGLTSIAEVCFF